MVYIHNWQEYQDAAEALYQKSPDKTRYCVKWKASDGKLILKITDDSTCLKFKTYSSIFLNRFEALNQSILQKMQNRRAAPPPAAAADERAATPAPAATTQAQTAPGQPPAATAGVSAGGVKKKKPKKKK